MQASRLATSLIDPPQNRHRVEITEESIMSLAKDIRDNGLINPITVMPIGERYEVIAGERRYSAMKFLGWPLMECRITDALSAADVEQLRLKENLERENLSPFEEAVQITALAALHQNDLAMTAKACHRSREWVASRLRLFQIQPELQPLVHSGSLKIGSALLLAEIVDDRDRDYYTRLSLHDGCTVQVLQRWVEDYHLQRLRQPDQPPTLPTMPQPGQTITVLMDCDLCITPTSTRERQPRFICPACQAIWADFAAAYREANAATHSHSQPAELTT